MECFFRLEQKKESNDLCVSRMICQTLLTKEIYGKKTIPRGRDKIPGTHAPP
jgi:hypothetical protein